jgi:hypothetical protein
MSIDLNPGDIVLVTWVASTAVHGWREPEEINPAAVVCESVGYFVFASEEVLGIAKNRGVGNSTSFGEYMSLPRVCTRHVCRLDTEQIGATQ